jgi:hypothetical protein
MACSQRRRATPKCRGRLGSGPHRLNALIASNTHPAIMLVPPIGAIRVGHCHSAPPTRLPETAARPAAARTAPGARSPLRARPERHQHRTMRERIQRRHVQMLLRQRVGHTVRCIGGQADRGGGQQRTQAGQQGRLTCATFQIEHEGSLRSALAGRQMKKRAAMSGAFSCPTLHGSAEAYLTAQ